MLDLAGNRYHQMMRSLPAAALTAILTLCGLLAIASVPAKAGKAQNSAQKQQAANSTATPSASQKIETIPVSEIQPGMKGVAYTIFSGDTVEPMDLEVIGVLHNALAPKQDIILVQLHGEKVEHTGVVAGMSGSPVYLDGRLAGALSMKLGIFSKEAIGGVTPIAGMMEVEQAGEKDQKDEEAKEKAGAPVNVGAAPASGDAAALNAQPNETASLDLNSSAENSAPTDLSQLFAAAIPSSLTASMQQRAALGSNKFLVPIETPLIFSGITPQVMEPFAKFFSNLGMGAPMSAMIGGTSPATPEDAQVKPGDMIGMELVSGDLSINAGCTVTAITGDRLLACGHPLFSYGKVALPLTRGHVVTTLASEMESTKIMSTSGVIGTLTEEIGRASCRERV